MKRGLGLGIDDPWVRVLAWLCGCAAASGAGLVAGPAAMIAAMLLLLFVAARTS